MAAIVVLALMALAIAPAVSAQQYEGELGEYYEARNEYHAAYSEWQGARTQFNQALTQWRGNRNNQNMTQLMNAAKTACANAANVMLKNMEMVKARIDATPSIPENLRNQIHGEIDNYMSEIQAKQLRVQNAGDDQQVRTEAGELNRYWQQIRIRLKQMTGLTMVESTNMMLQRVEAIAARVQARIQELKDNGVDTAEMESHLGELHLNMEQAREKLGEARNQAGQISENANYSEAFRMVQNQARETLSYMKQAMVALKNMVGVMRQSGHSITLEGIGTLTAQGDGSVRMVGTGTVEVKALIEGTIIVSANASVTTSGEGDQTTLGDGSIQYQGYDSAVIVGTDITVDISGNGIDIVASGTGTVNLTGSGTYSTFGESDYVEGTWTGNGVMVKLATGQAT